jgi:hypothetical protein
MRKVLLVSLAGALVGAAAGCGDNSRACGPNTMVDDKGYCVPVQCGPGTMQDPNTGLCVPDGSVVCTDGTKFDPASGKCVVDPNDCQNGTVLINNQCVDPTGGLTIDLEEGPEPNGLGIIEASQGPAGSIALKAVGGPGFIIHGKIAPFQDLDQNGQMDPDVDTYLLNVNAPTLLHMTADGVGGVDAGFVALAAVNQNDPLANWIRFGMNITGDTSKRELYLPRAGTYAIAIADTRTLFQYSTGGPTDAAPGPGDYYITVDTLATPTPTTLTVTNGTATQTGTVPPDADVQFYTAPMGTGLNEITLDMPDAQAVASIVLANPAANFRQVANEQSFFGASLPADMLAAGFTPTDQPLIAVDTLYNTAIDPSPYTLTVTTGSASPLSTTGAAVSEPEVSASPQSAFDLNAYYFDVSSADEIDGLALSWNHPVAGSLFDSNLNLVATYTDFSGSATWSQFTGLLRFVAPGRYYFFVYQPGGTVGSMLTATSKIAAITPNAVTEGTPTGAQTVDATYHSNVLSYNAGTTDPWQQFNATGSGTGAISAGWLNPATAYGRLDTLNLTGGATQAPDASPIFTHSFAQAGGVIGRVLLDDPTTNYLVKINTATVTSTPTFVLSFDKRTITDLATLAADGTTTSSANHTIDATTTAGYFLFRTGGGNPVTITTHPHSALLNTQFRRVNADESTLGATVDNPTGDDTTSYVQAGNGWTAVIVTATTPPATAQQYDFSVRVDMPVTYSEAMVTTTYTDICAAGGGGTPIVFNGGTDEGISAAAINAPTGFKFFGLPSGSFRVSTNGFLSFDTTLTDPAFNNQNLPNTAAPNDVVAPWWSDLTNVTACTKTVGTTLIVQWDGVGFNDGLAAHVQAILDGSDNSITFVWSSAHAATGVSATIGLEDSVGANAYQHSYDQAVTVAGKSFKYTPM